MEALTDKQIYGNWATLLLTINSKGRLDYTRLADEIDVLISSQPNGIYSNGTAGEFYAQTEEEFDKINQLLAEKCEREAIPFQIGVSHMSPQISLERLKRSKALNPSAFQVILPDWFPVTIKESINFLQRMSSEAGEIGIVLYNPPHAKSILQPEIWPIIKEAVPRLVGVKVFDHDGSEDWYRKARKHGKDLSVFVPGHNLATGISKGARGAYSNVACLSPFGAQRWYEMMETDLEQALAIEQRIHRFFSDHITPFITQKQYSNQAVDKLLAAIGDWADIPTRLRWPYRWIPEYTATKLRPIARKLLPEFF